MTIPQERPLWSSFVNRGFISLLYLQNKMMKLNTFKRMQMPILLSSIKLEPV
jgi:hypothetical protein